MDKVFRVRLSGDKDRCCELELPAARYALLDALDKLQMAPGDKPRWEFLDGQGFPLLHVHLVHECDLYQLNALAAALGKMDISERPDFEELINLAKVGKGGPVSAAAVMDLACSTDCSHVVNDAADTPPDFEASGRKAGPEAGGAFTSGGHVTRRAGPELAPAIPGLTPEVPTYAILLLVGHSPAGPNGQLERQVYLNLPAAQEELDRVPEACGAVSWGEMVFRLEDSAVPALLEHMDCGGIQKLNELAKLLKSREGSGNLSKLKAVIHATGCHDITTAIQIAQHLDDYLFEPRLRNPQEVALEELRFMMDERSLSVLKKHVDLYNYGRDVVVSYKAVLTPYGLVQRRDGSALLQVREAPSESGGTAMA